MRKKDEMSSNQEVGTPAYLVSSAWLKRYHQFILYDQFDEQRPEHLIKISANHFRDMHPGQMTTSNDLCEIDKDRLNLYGTGEYIDQYFDSNKNSQIDLAIFNEELFQFLFQRYGGQMIKRYWTRKGSGYTQVEIRLQNIRTQFLNSQLLIDGTFDKSMFKKWWT